MEHEVVATMLCYSYIYDMNVITYFLKSNISYIQPLGQPSTPPTPNEKLWVHYYGLMCKYLCTWWSDLWGQSRFCIWRWTTVRWQISTMTLRVQHFLSYLPPNLTCLYMCADQLLNISSSSSWRALQGIKVCHQTISCFKLFKQLSISRWMAYFYLFIYIYIYIYKILYFK